MSATARATIAGLGVNIPKKILTNAELERMVDTSDEWIQTRTGIKERRIAGQGETAASLGIPAAMEALDTAGVDPKDLDLIICATSTPDKVFPSTACEIQHGIGASECGAFDLLAACSGFIYGANVIDQFIQSGSARNALLVASEIFSKIVNWEDRSTCVLFGDGAAAAVFKGGEGSGGIIDSRIRSNGEFGDLLKAGGCTSNRPFYENENVKNGQYLEMIGNQTFKVAVKKMTDVTQELLKTNGLTMDDIALVIPHQANIRILNAVAKSLSAPDDKFYVIVNKYGNTSAASIPIALYEAQTEGRLKKGDVVLLVAFGGGLTWGATLVEW